MVFECYSGGVWLVFGGVWVELDSVCGGGGLFIVWVVFGWCLLMFGCCSGGVRVVFHSVNEQKATQCASTMHWVPS